MLETVGKWVLASKKAIAAFVVTGLVGFLHNQNIEVLPENLEWLQTFLEGVVAGVVVWFTTNRAGAVNRKR